MSEEIKLNSYKVLENIHHSRRFSLYSATKYDNDRLVLIKTPDSVRTKDMELIANLVSEAQACLTLQHPNIRKCYEYSGEASSAYMIAEYVEGMSLSRYMKMNPGGIELNLVLSWMKDILSALDYAHKQGYAHLNLNPHNLIVTPDKHIKILGFGKDKAAWMTGEQEDYGYHPLMFTTPELFQAEIALPAGDIFSVAVIAYLCICRVLPWRIDHSLGYVQQKKQSLGRAVIMPEILKVEMPDWLYGVILTCLKLDPNQRFGSAAELLEAINSGDAAPTEEPTAMPIPETEQTLPEPIAIIDEPAAIAVADLEELIPETESEPEIDVIEPEPEPEIDVIEPEPEIIAVEPEPIPVVTELESRTPITEEEEQPEPSFTIAEPEPHAYTPEPIPEEEIIPPLPEKPIIIETPKPEPPKKIDPPKPKPSPTTTVKPKLYNPNPIPKPTEPEIIDTRKLHKTFRTLLYLSLVVLVFYVFKYFVFGSRPKFQAPPDSVAVEELSQNPPEANKAINMVLAPADTLIMGSIAPGADDDEFPLVTVRMAPFYISTHEITQKEWLMVFPTNPSQNQDLDLPVENVSFYDIIEYCNAKSIKDGYRQCYDYYDTEVICNFEADGYRLPTEAEWESAARAGMPVDLSIYSGGNDADKVAWYNGNSDAHSHPGAKKEPNNLGLYDLSGNLYEWVWNWYAPYSYRSGDLYKGPDSGTDKVIRGGSWYHPVHDLRVSNRSFAKPYAKTPYIGFRLVRSVAN